ncbi:MAG TPA: hypothetical protein PLF03_06070 [Candidatus Omnitrophota bacterium]|nr:hypothetical protein [Candidatus Omnitrophota bacterium]
MVAKTSVWGLAAAAVVVGVVALAAAVSPAYALNFSSTGSRESSQTIGSGHTGFTAVSALSNFYTQNAKSVGNFSRSAVQQAANTPAGQFAIRQAAGVLRSSAQALQPAADALSAAADAFHTTANIYSQAANALLENQTLVQAVRRESAQTQSPTQANPHNVGILSSIKRESFYTGTPAQQTTLVREDRYADADGRVHTVFTDFGTGKVNKYYSQPGVAAADTYKGNGAFVNDSGADYSALEGYGQAGFGESRSEGSNYDSFGNCLTNSWD